MKNLLKTEDAGKNIWKFLKKQLSQFGRKWWLEIFKIKMKTARI